MAVKFFFSFCATHEEWVYWCLFSEVLPLQTVEMLWSPKAQESVSAFSYKDKSALKLRHLIYCRSLHWKQFLENWTTNYLLMQCHIAEVINPQLHRCRGLKSCSDRDYKKKLGRTLMSYVTCIMLYTTFY